MEREKQLLVSVIIPTINQVELVKKCVSSLVATTPSTIPYEIIVVDDGSPPETQRSLEEILRPFSAKLIIERINRGFSVTVNKGAACSRGSYLCLVNNDVIFPQANWLGLLLTAAEKTKAGVVGARLLYPDGRIQHGGIYYQAAQQRFDHEYRYKPGDFPPALETRGTLGVTGALMLIDRRLWDKIGGMDERFFLSWEDVDFCLRAWKAGWSVVYTGQAFAVHPEGFTRANKKEKNRSVWKTKEKETKKLFFSKWRKELSLLHGCELTGNLSISQIQAACWRRIIRRLYSRK